MPRILHRDLFIITQKQYGFQAEILWLFIVVTYSLTRTELIE